MEAYRDQYATIFNNGRGIVLVGISADADTTLEAWARESSFPMLFTSDTGGVVGTMYGAFDPARRIDDRSLYVIDADGKVAYTARPFRPLSAASYRELEDALDRIAPLPADSSG
ncbi:MAG: redoxin domain-containing protein [Gemmatimonadaceae bacterium]